MEQYTQSLPGNILLFIVSLLTCALFSFLETSITAIRLFNLKEIERSNPKYKTLFEAFNKHPQQVLISILIATDLASVTCAVVSQSLTESLFEKIQMPESLAFVFGILITTVLVSIFGEIIPKSVAKSLGTKNFTSTLWIINIFYIILSPIARIINNVSLFIARSNHQEEDHITSEKEIQFLINYIEEKNLMDYEKTAMLQNIFRMGQTSVKEILIPQHDIVSINVQNDISTFLDKFAEYQFSRFPVYQDEANNIVGIVYLKDILFALQKNPEIKLLELIRPIIFVPDNMKVNELLKEFKLQKIHMCMVLDEYGNTIGLVTLEDALEEIVGDIHDEHDANRDSEKIKVIKKDVEWSVDATIDLDRLHPLLKITFETQSAVTLGGFLSEQMQHLPKEGEFLMYKNFYFMIEKADAKRVLLVRVQTAEQAEKYKLHLKK
ncbi:HlyC/CorC family transporter [Candidatus Babeliales bacterium]|nr:HlyC/CorC family transporter [Candidatus Babeliales bacterium]MBP9843365.1 HlyC/CorC family transporter [Candidatus Babeliales bacterium]